MKMYDFAETELSAGVGKQGLVEIDEQLSGILRENFIEYSST